MNRKLGALTALAGMVAAPQSAGAQAWIGLVVGQMMAQEQAYAQEMACMNGTAMEAKEVAEVTSSAPAAMAAYWSAVAASKPALAAFHPGKKSEWINGEHSLGLTALDAIADPFARTGTLLAAEPLGLVRAGDGGSALGQWRVTATDGTAVGTYDVLFRRDGSRWLVSRMTLVDVATWTDPVVQYCHAPGDVLPFRVRNTAAVLAHATKQEAKAAGKFAKAEQKEAKAREDAAAKPGNIARAEALRAASADLVRRRETWEQRKSALAAAISVEAGARYDNDKFLATQAAGKAALAGVR